MPKKQTKLRSGHKGRRAAHDANTGKYIRQRARTEVNRLKKQARHKTNHPLDLSLKRD